MSLEYSLLSGKLKDILFVPSVLTFYHDTIITVLYTYDMRVIPFISLCWANLEPF